MQTTITLTKDQWQAISSAVDLALEDHFNTIREYADGGKFSEDSGAYSNMMNEFEKLAGVRAVLDHSLLVAA